MEQNEGQKIAAKACIDEFRTKSEEFILWLAARPLQYENAKNATVIYTDNREDRKTKQFIGSSE